MGGDGASVISGGNTGVCARYKENNPRVMMNHCACHKSNLSATDGAAGVPDLAVFDHQMKSFYNFFGHSVDRRTIHSHVQQRMQETVRHLKKGIVTRCVCALVPVRYRGLACGVRPGKHSFSIGKLTGAR
jgi:hypothetical protein